MTYDPRIHHRRSIRLHGYDYSRAGLYFVTICCQDKAHLFGHVENGIMKLNDAGRMVEEWYFKMESKYPDKKCHEMVIMPNHMHFILENAPDGGDARVGDAHVGDAHVGDAHVGDAHVGDAHAGAPQRGRPADDSDSDSDSDPDSAPGYGPENHQFNSPLGQAVGWLKTMTTNAYIRGVKSHGWKPFNRHVWQRNYFERIIWTDKAYQRISQYIIDNPKKWSSDRFHK